MIGKGAMELKYGRNSVSFIPDKRFIWQTIPQEASEESQLQTQGELDIAIKELLLQLHAQSLPPVPKFLLIIPDHTRRCRIDEILTNLVPALKKEFQSRIEILIANGSHVPQSDSVVQNLVGDYIYKNYPISQHNALDESTLFFAGETSFKTPIWLNKKVRDADFIVTIGGILFHYFAGFGGGAKMLLPGVAGSTTIRINHRRTIDVDTGLFHKDCQEGNIETNPVFLDLAEIVHFVPNVLSLQLVLDANQHIVVVKAGPILPVHRLLCEQVSKIYGIRLEKRADVVIASANGYPADANLIQSHKSIHHAFQAVREGGILILLAECSEGVGSKYFMSYFDCKSSEEMAQRLMKEYQINGHTALALKSKAERIKIILVSALDPEVIRKTGMIPSQTMKQAWRYAQKYVSKSSLGYIFPDAARYVPFVQ